MIYNAKNNIIDVDDTTVNYISFGSGEKNLIIIPGLGDGLKTVKGLAIPFSIMYKMFAKDYKVYVFSRKNELEDDYNTIDMANDIKNILDKINIDKASVVGVSQGGMIAQYMAINYPELVEKLVLVVTLSKQNKIVNERVNKWINYAKEGNYKDLFIDTMENSYQEETLNKYRKMYPILTKVGKPKDFNRFLIEAKACLTHNAYRKLSKIKCPTLIIGGKKDKIVGVDASYEMHEKIKKSELYIYDDYGHSVYEEAKDFNKIVYDFLIK